MKKIFLFISYALALSLQYPLIQPPSLVLILLRVRNLTAVNKILEAQWSYGYRSVLESTQLTLVSNHFNSIIDANGFHDELEGYYDVVAIYANTGNSDVLTNFNGHGNISP